MGLIEISKAFSGRFAQQKEHEYVLNQALNIHLAGSTTVFHSVLLL